MKARKCDRCGKFYDDYKPTEETKNANALRLMGATQTSAHHGGCGDCSHADHKRKQGEKVRCTRWSRWVSPQEKPCEEHTVSFPFNITPEQYLESLAMMKNYQRKHGGNFV